MATLAEAGGPIATVGDCSSAMKALWGVTLDDAETARALGVLSREGRVERDASGYALTADEAAQMELVAAESRECRTSAVAEWRKYLLDQWPGLTPEQLDRLEEDLDRFLQMVVARHAAEATLTLYPDVRAAENRYLELEDAGFSVLQPAEPEIEHIRDGAISHFVRRPTSTQRAYLAQMLNTSYFKSVLSIDSEGARLVREIVSGQRVYLDTNFIYRLLGIQGPRHVRPAQTIVKRTMEAGYEVAVTPWTVEEFRNSLERAKDELKRHPIPPSDYAELLADATSDEDFVTAYWRQVKEAPIKVQDFYAHWREVETHLAEIGITVIAEGCTAVGQRTDEITDQLSVLARVLHGRYRHPAIVEHDVKHRMLVQRLRGDANRSFATAGYWFLTFDSVLPRYDFAARREDGSEIPFCVSAGSWFQIIEAFRSKTDDDAQVLADLLASPYVRYRRTLSKDKAQAVVARMQLHKGGSPELAARIMMNSALIAQIEESTDEAQTATIDNAIVLAAEQAQDDARRAQELAAAERQRAEAERAQAAATVREATERLETERRAADESKAQLAREADDRREEAIRAEEARREEAVRASEHRAEQKLRDEREAHKRQLAEVQKELDSESIARKRLRRRVRASVATLLIAVLAMIGLLAVGLDTVWAALVGIGVLLGVAAAVDQLWVNRD